MLLVRALCSQCGAGASQRRLLGPSCCRSKGYARAALSALSDWALRHDEVHRLELYVEPWNEPSWRTAASCGYRREGLLRSWQQVGDTRRDMYMYSRLADDNLVEG